MAYTLSTHINPDKIFIINRSELAERFDSLFYKDKIDTTNFIKLSRVAKVSGGKRLPLGENYSDEATEYRYLRIGDINWGGTLNFQQFKYLSRQLYSTLKRYEIFKNELLIAIVGATIGKVSIHNIDTNEKIILTENCAKISIKDNRVIPDFLFMVMQMPVIQKQVQLNFIQTTLPKLGLDRVESLLLPKIPSRTIQEELVFIYKKAFTQKQQKEAEAKLLLESIDAYLLNELGITLPEKDNSLQSRIFTASFSDVTGGRFDIFDIFNKEIKVEGGFFENKKLKGIATFRKGQSITSEKIIAGDYPVIAGGKSSPYNHNHFNFDGESITVSASGAYSGYVWFHNSPIFASDCTVIKSKNDSVISTYFLFEILKLKQKEIYNLQQGAGQPHVYANDLEKLNIPLPPLTKQNKIANHIQQIRIRAKQLQTEATAILENAKAEIEKMILQ